MLYRKFQSLLFCVANPLAGVGTYLRDQFWAKLQGFYLLSGFISTIPETPHTHYGCWKRSGLHWSGLSDDLNVCAVYDGPQMFIPAVI